MQKNTSKPPLIPFLAIGELSSDGLDLLHLRAPVWTLIHGEEQQPLPSRAGTNASPARYASTPVVPIQFFRSTKWI